MDALKLALQDCVAEMGSDPLIMKAIDPDYSLEIEDLVRMHTGTFLKK
jgi:hypothetical protein